MIHFEHEAFWQVTLITTPRINTSQWSEALWLVTPTTTP